ncbi:DUF1801 domain-containing protein [Mucilaginibacter xinganensis]|uniref:YdhG-like domain-containing protein n=1 Tax=Mucilaginibacter xinganensis TaxID=1234841 RepID=A0A223NXP3_9SPHI|nr:DUF1801 domain-containing protein [Mucilaginibacter xinganensis]ASU34560.1 hypothetical protein MuYL_2673 [Mucilaginibacter xinganensis]
MGKETVDDLVKFMLPYSDSVKASAIWLREFVWELYPESNELIYDNYNAVAFGWSTSDRAGDVFCSIAVCSDHVNFGFNRGIDFPDPEKLLIGNGTLYRYLQIRKKEDFPEAYIKQLLEYAYENSISRLKPAKTITQGQTIVKSISAVKKRPGGAIRH